MAEITEDLEVVAGILWRAAVIGFAFLLLWVALYVTAGDLMLGQAQMFGLSAHETALLHYGGMGLFKILLFIFYFFPFLAIRWYLCARGKNEP